MTRVVYRNHHHLNLAWNQKRQKEKKRLLNIWDSTTTLKKNNFPHLAHIRPDKINPFYKTKNKKIEEEESLQSLP